MCLRHEVDLNGDELYCAEVHLYGPRASALLPARLMNLVWNVKINPSKASI
jgi:hypothetical protein